MIKDLKSLYVREEEYFGAPYDPTSNDWKELKFSELQMSKNEEKLEMIYANKDRKLQAKTRTGRKSGKLSFKKGVDTSLIAKHLTLVSAALGSVHDDSMSATIDGVDNYAAVKIGGSLVDNGHYIGLQVDGDFTGYEGRPVKMVAADGTKLPYNIIESVGVDEITLKFPTRDSQAVALTAGGGTVTVLKETVLGKPDTKNSFSFCAEYDDGSVEVFRGCGVTAKMEFNTEGLGTIDFEVTAAIAGNRDNSCDNTGAFYTPISGTIALEGEHLSVIYDFCDNYVNSLVSPSYVPKWLVASVFSLSVANNLLPFPAQGGGTNNISQFYTEGVVNAEAEYSYTQDVIELFGPANEDSNIQYIEMAQSDFMIYSPANFTNETMGGTVNDTAKYNVDLNFSTTRECWLVLPQ